ncbi:ketosteroid isomerase-like protein [Variovorax boronicumulans]|uniref:Ketosteroid isomerase-like protein n=1 Tax=Variovorax boronicumulans TaxID=436515 RepID=A0AAW8DTZ7_9BURK|nr:nuclear transport factor 2 family protein [Variovorax boronicumulans]MDP9877639.1 ketosteroid isomerase-like protein [Variovorax boronicumulans]MDP9922924.1 ketosteroid isomerase-like protein [Variovorax boronicumulans]
MDQAVRILRLEEERRAAMLAGDEHALRRLLAPDLRYVHSTGSADSRESLIARLASGHVVYQRLCFDRLAVTHMPDCALVSGEMRAQVHRDGELRDIATCYLAVWLRREDAWQLAAFQGTTLPAH